MGWRLSFSVVGCCGTVVVGRVVRRGPSYVSSYSNVVLGEKGLCIKSVCRRKELMKRLVKIRSILAKTRLFLIS